MKRTGSASDKLCLVVRVYQGTHKRAVSKMYLTGTQAMDRWQTRRYGGTGLRYMAIFSPKDKRGVRWQTKRIVFDAEGRLT